MKKSVFTAIVSGVAVGVILLGAIIFGTSVSLAQGGASRADESAKSVTTTPTASSVAQGTSAGAPGDVQAADTSDAAPEPADPPAPPAGAATGTLLLLYMGGQPMVVYNVGLGEDCSGKTIMNYNLPNDGSESELHLSNDDGSCSSSVSFGINDRLQACMGRSASVFEVRVNGAVVQSLTYIVTGPATGCEEFN